MGWKNSGKNIRNIGREVEPREIKMARWYFVYVLRSDKDKNLYTGYTNDLKKRVKEHNEGKVTSTKNRVPLRLIYFEASYNKYDAIHREKYLKTTYGKRYLKNRLKNYFSE